MSERWSQFVRAGMDKAGSPVAFALQQWLYFLPLTEALRRHVPQGGHIIDIGCGAGVYPSLLSHHGFRMTGVDNEPDLVALSTEMAEYLRANAQFAQADAFDLSRWHGTADATYSLGVIEHFDPDDTVRLIEEQARCAPVVFVVVPTKHTRYFAPPTDERLHTRRTWDALVRRAGLRVVESFVFGHVPSRAFQAMRLLPGPLGRRVANVFDLGMNICCIGRR